MTYLEYQKSTWTISHFKFVIQMGWGTFIQHQIVPICQLLFIAKYINIINIKEFNIWCDMTIPALKPTVKFRGIHTVGISLPNQPIPLVIASTRDLKTHAVALDKNAGWGHHCAWLHEHVFNLYTESNLLMRKIFSYSSCAKSIIPLKILSKITKLNTIHIFFNWNLEIYAE